MSETMEKSDYLLLFRGNMWERGLSPDELKRVLAGFEDLEGIAKAVTAKT